jgi:hypothetical protein
MDNIPLKDFEDILQTTRKIEQSQGFVHAYPPEVSHQDGDFYECVIHNVHTFRAFFTIHTLCHCLQSIQIRQIIFVRVISH